jgi:Signal transduction histidine kinase
MIPSHVAPAAGIAILLAGGALIDCAGAADPTFLEMGLLASMILAATVTALLSRREEEEAKVRPCIAVLLSSALLSLGAIAVFVVMPSISGPHASLISSLVRVHGSSIGWAPAFAGPTAIVIAVGLDLIRRARLGLETRILWYLSAVHLLFAAALAAVFVSIIIAGGEGTRLLAIVRSAQGAVEAVSRIIIFILCVLSFYAAITALTLVAATPVSLLVSAVATREAVRRLGTLLAAVESFDPLSPSRSVPVDRPDEIGRLSAGFNAMATRLESATEELRKARDRNETLLRSRRELMAGLSHDLRTPIAKLYAILEAQNHKDSEQPFPEAVRSAMLAQVNILVSLTEDLVDTARGDAERLTMHPTPLDPAPILVSIAESFEALAKTHSGIAVACEVEPLQPNMAFPSLDPRLLERAVSNLLRNALCHAGPGDIVLLQGRAEGEGYAIEVRNTVMQVNSGSSENDNSFLAPSGLKLGLTLAREYTEAMGGHLVFHLEASEATVRCFFPS